MKEEEKEQFLKSISKAAVLYERNLTAEQLEWYWACCKQLSLQEVRESLFSHSCDSARGCFMPKPADIIRHANGKEDYIENEWHNVSMLVATVGSYASLSELNLTDENTRNAIIEMGGWKNLCKILTIYNTKKIGEEFKTTYKTMGEKQKLRFLDDNVTKSIGND